jgi:hypothetical protein
MGFSQGASRIGAAPPFLSDFIPLAQFPWLNSLGSIPLALSGRVLLYADAG